MYFGGADNDPPEPSEMQDPPPSGYRLSAAQLRRVRCTLDVHAIRWRGSGSRRVFVPLGQPAEPVIPLLLDARGARHAVAGTPLGPCPSARRP